MQTNERLVGDALRETKLARDEIFFTTKLPPRKRGYEQTAAAIQESLSNCGLGYIDLYLIHAPYGTPQERLGQWRAIEEAIDAGQIRAGGVSNYNTWHIQELLDNKPKHRPQINQIDLHPWLQRTQLVNYCRENDIAPEAYSPLTRGQKIDDPTLRRIADRVGRTPGQVLLRWSLQKGFVTLPKSVTPSRIDENFDIFSFELDGEAMRELDALECGLVTGWDPTTSPL